MANKILKTLTLLNAQGELVTYELHPEWDNIEGKPNFDSFIDLSGLTEQVESKLEMKLLWTNASYTSSFAAQTIEISSLSDYDLVFIVALVQTTNTARVAPVLVKVPAGTGAYLHVATGAGAGLMTATREVVKITSSAIEFGDAVYSSTIGATSTINNHYCIPYKVYGLKGVQ